MNETAKQKWLADRRSGLGGTDAAAIMGLSRFKTPVQVCLDKWGELPEQPDNDRMRYGRMQEPVIRQWYADTTGRSVTVPEGVVRHGKYPFILGSFDGLTDDGRLLEIKTAQRGDEWGEPGTDEIPDAYMCQVQHYMMITGLPVADVVVSIAGTMPLIYEVPADREIHELFIDRECSFWNDHVLKHVLPDCQTADDVAFRFRKSLAKSIQATPEIVTTINELCQVREAAKRIKEQEEKLKLSIMGIMGECDTLVGLNGKPLATWKSDKASARFDADAFKAAHADLYAQFLKTGESSRRFLLK